MRYDDELSQADSIKPAPSVTEEERQAPFIARFTGDKTDYQFSGVDGLKTSTSSTKPSASDGAEWTAASKSGTASSGRRVHFVLPKKEPEPSSEASAQPLTLGEQLEASQQRRAEHRAAAFAARGAKTQGTSAETEVPSKGSSLIPPRDPSVEPRSIMKGSKGSLPANSTPSAP